jgi:pimeloyl-ACP methyl ester carboxylesterase
MKLSFCKGLAVCVLAGFATSGSGFGWSPAQAQSRRDPLLALGKGFVSRRAKVNGTTLHYVRGGSGPALVLIHGFPQDWSEFHRIMPRLAKKFTVVAVDLRGVGGSSPAPGGFDKANLAEDVYQLTRQLHLQRVYVAGHDIGGMVAYAFVRRHPGATRGAMILDVPLPGIGPWEQIKASPFAWYFTFHQTPDLPEELLAGRQAVYFRDGFFKHFSLNQNAISAADVTHYARAYAAPGHLRAGLGFYRAFPADEKFNAAQQNAIDVPIVLAGAENFMGRVNPAIVEALRKHGCANVTTVAIKNSGHYVAEEQPEIVAQLIERYASR